MAASDLSCIVLPHLLLVIHEKFVNKLEEWSLIQVTLSLDLKDLTDL